MPNLRIVYNNLVDSVNTDIIAHSSAGSGLTTVADNLKKDSKSLVWRSSATSTSSVSTNLVVSFGGTQKTVQVVAMPFTNLTGAATMRIRGYSQQPPVQAGTVDAPTVTLGTGNPYAVIYDGTRYISVGYGGTILYSTSSDFSNSTYCADISSDPRFLPTYYMFDIVFSGGIYVIGCSAGYIATSTNGINWTLQEGLRSTSFGNVSVEAVGYANGYFYAGGNGGLLAYSTDGVTWTYAKPSVLSSRIREIVFNGTGIMLGCADGRTCYSTTPTVTTSWTLSTSLASTTWGATQDIYSLIWVPAATRWIVGGELGGIAHSTDNGVTWTYVAPDGVDWTNQVVNVIISTGTSLLKLGGLGRAASSTDYGNTWTPITSLRATGYSTGTTLDGIQVGTTTVIVGSNLRWAKSTDSGTTWTYNYGYITPNLAFDTGFVNCCAWNSLDLGTWSPDLSGVAKYSYGGGTYAVVWIPLAMQVPVHSISIEITDTRTGTDKYVEAGKLIVGSYWEPKYNTSYGVTTGTKDLSEHARTESGDLITNRLPKYNTLSFDLRMIDSTDRATFSKILLGNGKPRPIFVSIFPEEGTDNESLIKERNHTIYGKLVQVPGLENFALDYYSTRVELEEV